MKNLPVSIILILLSLSTYGQQDFPTRDSTHIFWQPGLRIHALDYKGDTIPTIMNLMRKYNFSASASVGIWSIVDIPKKKNERGKKLEKVYFAPAFERTTSFSISNDTLEISKQNLFLDICEFWARWARNQLSTYQDTMKGFGTILIMYSTVKQDMEQNKRSMFQSYFKDVYIDKKDEAFSIWRSNIYKALNDSQQWTTKPEECYRLMIKKPVDDSYIQAPTLVGPLQNPKNNTNR
jgi:hypothetical protein